MAGCGGLSAGVRHPGQPPRTAAAEPSGALPQVPPPSDPSGEVAAAGRHRPHRTSAQPEPPSPVCVRRPSTRPAAGHHGGRVRRSAAVAAGRCAAWVRTPTGDAARVADTCCPQRGQRTGRRPLAERPAAMPVEAAAEGPQRFHPDGGNGIGWRTPDRSRVAFCLDTPSARGTIWPHRTPQAADGQSADRSARYNFLYSSQGRPAGGRLRRPSSADRDTTGRDQEGSVRSCYFTVTVMQSLISTWVPSVLITRKTMSN
jgi:hypothetical protein